MDELRQAFGERCRELEVALAPRPGSELPPDAPLESGQWADDVLAPELFGLTVDGDPVGPISYTESAVADDVEQLTATRLELPAELFHVEGDGP